MRKPLVSVVIPAYNASEFIAETLHSALEQTFRGFEIIVVDDGSTDDTAGVVGKCGNSIRLIRTKNRGVAEARNTGLACANGEYIAFLDSDDIWEPSKLEKQLELVTDQCRFVYTDTVSFGLEAMTGLRMSAGRPTMPSGNIVAELVEGNFIATSSVLLHRDIAIEAGGFRPELKIVQDWNLWLQAARRTRVAYLHDPLVKYRVRSGSLGTDLERRLRESMGVVETGLDLLQLSADEKGRLRRRARAGSYDYVALLANAEGKNLIAMRYAFGALMSCPSTVRLNQLIKSVIGNAWTERLLAAKAMVKRAGFPSHR